MHTYMHTSILYTHTCTHTYTHHAYIHPYILYTLDIFDILYILYILDIHTCTHKYIHTGRARGQRTAAGQVRDGAQKRPRFSGEGV